MSELHGDGVCLLPESVAEGGDEDGGSLILITNHHLTKPDFLHYRNCSTCAARVVISLNRRILKYSLSSYPLRLSGWSSSGKRVGLHDI